MAIIVDFGGGLVGADGGVLLSEVYLNAADNPADLCSFRFAGDSIGSTADSRAEVRQLINRRRVIRKGAKVYDQIGLDLRQCTPEQQQWLRDHVATIVCARDHVGSKVYATYLQLPREIDTTYRDRADVQLSLDEITFSEAT